MLYKREDISSFVCWMFPFLTELFTNILTFRSEYFIAGFKTAAEDFLN